MWKRNKSSGVEPKIFFLYLPSLEQISIVIQIDTFRKFKIPMDFWLLARVS